MSHCAATHRSLLLCTAALFAFGGCATFNFSGDADGKSVPTYSARTFYETTTVWGGFILAR